MRWIAKLAIMVWVAAGGEVWARGPDVTPNDLQLYIDWRDGREDPRLEKYSEEVKLKKIARSLKVSTGQLKAAIKKVEPLMPVLAPETEKAIRASLGQTPVAKRVLSVELNIDTGHAVAWIKWRCGDARDVDKEAAFVGWAVADSAPVVKIVGLWCVNKIDTKLFSAKIGRPAFERIGKATIERFASSRYIRLFEEVKRGPHR